MKNASIDVRVEDIFELYTSFGADDYIGEPVSQVEHMSQAAELAIAGGADKEMVLAAFFHDLGHLLASRVHAESMDGYGAVDHEKLGSDYLNQMGFSRRLCSLIKNHVQAKRYLTLTRPGYYDKLSEASLKTLEFQGGRMTESEADRFEADPWFKDHIRLREWDEQAKIEHVPVLDIEMMKRISRELLAPAEV